MLFYKIIWGPDTSLICEKNETLKKKKAGLHNS